MKGFELKNEPAGADRTNEHKPSYVERGVDGYILRISFETVLGLKLSYVRSRTNREVTLEAITGETGSSSMDSFEQSREGHAFLETARHIFAEDDGRHKPPMQDESPEKQLELFN